MRLQSPKETYLLLQSFTGISRRRIKATIEKVWMLRIYTGGVGSECSMFLASGYILADKLSIVTGEEVNVTMEWLRT